MRPESHTSSTSSADLLSTGRASSGQIPQRPRLRAQSTSPSQIRSLSGRVGRRREASSLSSSGARQRVSQPKDHRTPARPRSWPTNRAIAGTRRNAFDRKRSCVSLAVGPVPGHPIVAIQLVGLTAPRSSKRSSAGCAPSALAGRATGTPRCSSRCESRCRPVNVFTVLAAWEIRPDASAFAMEGGLRWHRGRW